MASAKDSFDRLEELRTLKEVVTQVEILQAVGSQLRQTANMCSVGKNFRGPQKRSSPISVRKSGC